MIKLYFLETNEELIVPEGTKLIDYVSKFSKYHQTAIVAAKIDNSIVELNKKLDRGGNVSFIDLTTLDGLRIYQRGVLFLLHMVLKEMYQDYQLWVLHSVGNALYCELRKNGYRKEFSEEEIVKIKSKMSELVKMDITFEKHEFYKEDAFKIFTEQGDADRIRLFKFRKKKTIKLYKCLNHYDYYYGYMPPSTGYLTHFDLQKDGEGFLVVLPDRANPENISSPKKLPKLSSVFLEYARWLDVIGINTVADLNELIARGEREVVDLMILNEALHEKRIAQIAEQFSESMARLILIAGPSSSGKTTFAKRLLVQLKVFGYKPVTVSLDDYFVDREKTPKDENGNPDFESIEAIDLDLFNQHLVQLLDGKEVELPKFDFKIGKRIPSGKKVKVDKNQPIVVEGIHGLNEKLTSLIDRSYKFKIYVSALTQLNLDAHNRITTTDTRLLRRIVRDYKFRGHSALETIMMWPSVRRGEEKYIFPFQEEADTMFNSAIVYELAVLKTFAEQLLVQISQNASEYTEALRLTKLLDYFLPITNIEDIPRTSILREFIGRSAFKY
ncbi:MULTISPECIES: nucleoside kinase [Pseudothermotoga]|uniref:nucleoside kinase n=1 Tax=Pseudothermotoga TaxID=1643951 RepID=UPI0004274814|nr:MULTISPECIES: nucleoside kinase [Pseudothermotoga]KUK20798.1 MAG: Phosphoribulokinase/uridine kinase [Pseudothermotoga lettingae]MDI3494300.1 uridine kinase [Pseudothermotoga sp.]MDK2884089.1 uridine kinase [Pseudothermotoga sp.]HBJ82114.1 nucleoside kinase [Pseudothermotoga sp.]HBT25649.1 nucleoside kinase [Pseudothermotoga sp.]